MNKAIEDLDKIYTQEELLDMRCVDHYELTERIKLVLSDSLTEVDKSILKEADEILNAPYAFAANPFMFDPLKEKESIEREQHIRDILDKRLSIMKAVQKKMPPNMYKTAQNIKANTEKLTKWHKPDRRDRLMDSEYEQ